MSSLHNFKEHPFNVEAVQSEVRAFLRQCGAVLEDGTWFLGRPYVCLHSYKTALDLADFAGCIHFMKGSGMHSGSDSPFPKDICRITIKQSPKGVGRLIVHPGVCLMGSCIVAMERVEIEHGVLLGPSVTIMDTDGHGLDRTLPDTHEYWTSRPVRIGHHAWIGMGATILKGVTVGPYAVVAAHSIVTKDVPPHGIVGGNPAKLIKVLEPKGLAESP